MFSVMQQLASLQSDESKSVTDIRTNLNIDFAENDRLAQERMASPTGPASASSGQPTGAQSPIAHEAAAPVAEVAAPAAEAATAPAAEDPPPNMEPHPPLDLLLRSGTPLTTCQWAGRGKAFPNFRRLVNHIKKAHFVTDDRIKDQWVHEEAWRERTPTTITEVELDHAALVWTAGGEVDEADDAKAWNANWDATLRAHTSKRANKARLLGLKEHTVGQKAHCRARLQLTRAILDVDFGQDVAQPEERAQARAIFTHPKPKNAPKPAAPPAAEDPVAMEDSLAMRQIKSAGPYGDTGDQDIYIVPRQRGTTAVGLDAVSVAAMGNLAAAMRERPGSRVAAAHTDATGATPPSPLAKVTPSPDAAKWEPTRDDAYRHAWPLPQKPLELPHCDAYIKDTRGFELVTADAHVQRMQQLLSIFSFPLEAGPFGAPAAVFKSNLGQGAVKQRKDIGNLWKSHFAPLKARPQRDSEASGARKHDFGEGRTEMFLTAEVGQAAASSSMIDLHTIWQQAKEGGGLAPIAAQRAANIITMGITHCNSFGGRPGELEKLKRKQLLRRHGWVHLTGHARPGPNPRRKFLAAEAGDEDNLEKAQALVAEVSAHRHPTAKRHHKVQRPGKLATKSAATFKGHRGDPLP
ncbi:unnamed protein product [Prorocentrum cordatum]|uniref:Uncharacterized protein n=1 Tax=Prorocentrum cordatum TaxID=2364126 RepID=A0ABN9XL88_9DINO|nr:unnamed protein product [Polarella glacialis]